jgi:hypothetical protein
VTDLATEILPRAKMFDNKFNPMRTVNTDDKETILLFECGKTYNVRAEKEAILPRKKGDYCRRRRKKQNWI